MKLLISRKIFFENTYDNLYDTLYKRTDSGFIVSLNLNELYRYFHFTNPRLSGNL